MTAPNPVFKFSRDVFTVKVENIAKSVSRNEVAELFTSLIGDLNKCEEFSEGGRRHLVLSFQTQDAAKKALCMTGYTVAGVPLKVMASAPSEPLRSHKHGKQTDDRRNLYVLGLPFDLTKSEFVEIFSHYGTVSHAVILATVDNVSRRRGFIVMNNHSEAKVAMDAMSRREIKGHTIDVSWAVVQRSHGEGFLDGGDRSTVIANQSPSPSPAPFELIPANSGAVSVPVSVSTTPLPDRVHASLLASPTSTITVTNLPAVLFSQVADLRPLFCPFGEIKKLEILEASPVDTMQGNVSVKVEYSTVSQAKDARDGLDGQIYSSSPVKVEFVQSPYSPELDVCSISSAGDSLQTGLNPRAPPFVVQPGISADAFLAPVAPVYADSATGNPHITANFSNGLLAVNPYAFTSYATPPNLYYVPVAGAIRPNSAPTIWTNAQLQSSPGPWNYPQLQQFPNVSATSLRSN